MKSKATRLLPRAWVLATVLLVAGAAAAQTVRPPLVEYRGDGQGWVELYNDSLVPMRVVVEPRSFRLLEDGTPEFLRLDERIHVRLSTMGFTLPPRQSRYVFYEAKAENLPAWFVLVCSMSGPPQPGKLQIRYHLLHTVYLVQKQALDKSELAIRNTSFDSQKKVVLVEVENTGEHLGRSLGAEARSSRDKRSSGGFPLFPHSRRKLQIAWDAPEAPEKVVLLLPKSTLEQKLSVQSP